MTESLANVLRARLANLPMMDRLVGLVRPRRITTENDGTQITPWPVELYVGECENDPLYLVPDDGTASIFFFEDLGSVQPGIQNVPDSWLTRLRLLGWLNPQHFAAPIQDTVLVETLLSALGVRGGRRNNEPFLSLSVAATVLPADSSLFSNYTDLPLLQPPYRVVGIELVCTYQLAGCPDLFPIRTGGGNGPAEPRQFHPQQFTKSYA